MRRLAALDIGSNTIVLLVADVDGDRLHELVHQVEMPQLGMDLATTGRIGAERQEHALSALAALRRVAVEHGAEVLIAGATAAVREATDARQFLAAATQVLGVHVRLVSAELEARLSFRAVAARHAVAGPWVMVDLGGNSTEIVNAHGKQLDDWRSLELGSGGFAASRLSDPPLPAEQADLRAAAKARLGDVSLRRAEKTVLTGGSPIYLPRLFDRAWMDIFTRGDVETARVALASAKADVLAERFQLPRARIEVLRGAVEIIEAILDLAAEERIFLSREGIPHGMVLAYAEREEDWSRIPSPSRGDGEAQPT